MRVYIKKSIVLLFLLLCQLPTSISYAEEVGAKLSDDTKTTDIIVTEDIPGAECEKIGTGTGVTNRKYSCKVKTGFAGVEAMLREIIRYMTFLSVLVGIFMLVASGIQMSLSGLEPGSKEAAKKRIGQVIQGFVLLFAVGLILSTIAPWIYE